LYHGVASTKSYSGGGTAGNCNAGSRSHLDTRSHRNAGASNGDAHSGPTNFDAHARTANKYTDPHPTNAHEYAGPGDANAFSNAHPSLRLSCRRTHLRAELRHDLGRRHGPSPRPVAGKRRVCSAMDVRPVPGHQGGW